MHACKIDFLVPKRNSSPLSPVLLGLKGPCFTLGCWQWIHVLTGHLCLKYLTENIYSTTDEKQTFTTEKHTALKIPTRHNHWFQTHKPTENDSNIILTPCLEDGMVSRKISMLAGWALNPKIKLELKGIFVSLFPSFLKFSCSLLQTKKPTS